MSVVKESHLDCLNTLVQLCYKSLFLRINLQGKQLIPMIEKVLIVTVSVKTLHVHMQNVASFSKFEIS